MSRLPSPTPDDRSTAEIDRLVVLLRHGELSSAERTLLEQLVCTNAKARRRYIRLVSLASSLEWKAGPDGSAGNRGGSDTPARTAAASDLGSGAPLPLDDGAPSNPAPTSAETRGALPLLPDLRSPGIFGFLSAIFVVAVAAAYWLPARAARQEKVGDKSPPQLAVAGQSSFRATTVRLEEGRTNLTLSGVGKVAVDGPAEFELLDPLRAKLNYGRIRMTVSERTGHGFTVETPHGNVVDLGTEFGLNVAKWQPTELVVFQGRVDLQLRNEGSSAERTRALQGLSSGEAVRFGDDGDPERITALVAVDRVKFQAADEIGNDINSVITGVTDNLKSSRTKKFYEIVPGGLREDAIAYVDRPKYQWNGTSRRGIPAYLLGADYVKTFNSDKSSRDTWIEVTLAAPADLYLFFDARITCPRWLEESFEFTGDQIGLDLVRTQRDQNGQGPGQSIDQHYDVYKRTVPEAGTVKLGPNYLNDAPIYSRIAMYGIAAVPIKPKRVSSE